MQIALFIVPMFAIMYFLMIRPERKKQADAQALLSSLKKGDDVVLTSGVFGKIQAVDDKTVVVEVADKVRLKVLKQAVMGPSARYLQTAADPKKLEDKKSEAKPAEEASDKKSA